MPSKFPLTDEQIAITGGVKAGKKKIKIKAGAGAGKTSTLKEIAEQAGYSQRVVYFAYNRSIADEAKRTFPKNTQAGTAHSISGGYPKYRDRINGPRLPAREVVKRLRVYEGVRIADKYIDPIQLVRLAAETVTHFCYSTEMEPRIFQVPALDLLDKSQQIEVRKAVLPIALKYWADIQSPRGVMRFEHDHYLKMWAMNGGRGVPQLLADKVMLDEAQDANPIIASVVEGQKNCQIILVGDENQAIYGWRGAVDAMDKFDAEQYMLTQSFRFGPEIAEQANIWLECLKSDLRIKGFDQIKSTIGPLPESNAIICRTNFGAMTEVISCLAQGKQVYVNGGVRQIQSLLRAASDLRRGEPTTHPELFMFESWDELKEYVENDHGGGDLKVFVGLVEKIGIRNLIDACNQVLDDDDERHADVVITTAHKAKGREWKTVRIAGDFREPGETLEGEEEDMSREEMMLNYVTVTRAMHTLDLGSLSFGKGYLDRSKEPKPPIPDEDEWLADVLDQKFPPPAALVGAGR